MLSESSTISSSGSKASLHVRALLETRGASPAELDEHTAEIDRIRGRLAELVKEESRDGFDLNREMMGGSPDAEILAGE